MERGKLQHAPSEAVKLAVRLATLMELIQRRISETIRLSFGNRDDGIDSRITAPPRVSSVSDTSVELDLKLCGGCGPDTEAEYLEFEVALGNVVIGEDIDYTIIYRGIAKTIRESGLQPCSEYSIKCRTLNSYGVSNWSTCVSFTTSSGFPFTFCSHKCGPDIILSSGGLVATYSGDDSWSMVLGSHPLLCGIVSWEVRIRQSTTAYIFVGVAKAQSDLCTFLGGDENGWGFIGEQALYHSREKVQVYGESFAKGDVVGVSLDLEAGTLSFSRNGKTLGVGFNNVFGELYPAVAFYNAGQEVELLLNNCRGNFPHEPPLVSPSRIIFSDVSLYSEIQYCLAYSTPIPLHICAILAGFCNEWSSSMLLRRRAVSGRFIILNKNHNLLQSLNLNHGDKVRTPYGLASVAGSAGGKLWVEFAETREVWFFSRQQVLQGQVNGFFLRPTYQFDKKAPHAPPSYTFDVDSIQDLLLPSRWSAKLDAELMRFLREIAFAAGITIWDITPDDLSREFRQLQQRIIRVCMEDAGLSVIWGIKGPSRRAVVVRCGILRLLNQLSQPLALYLDPSGVNEVKFRRKADEALPFIMRIIPSKSNDAKSDIAPSCLDNTSLIPYFQEKACDVELSGLRNFIFLDTKLDYLEEQFSGSGERPCKTDDEYDYPEDLPQVKLNRYRSHRVLEYRAEGEEILFSSMLGQLWREIRSQPQERLRIRYTHPMDDGQARAFKVRFEGEGVDDYGGPYRDVFQSICAELQRTLDHPKATPQCLVPLLCPTANWAVECEERYCFTFDPSQISDVHLDLYRFLGQLVGIAMRSKLTLDLSLPSFIWKKVVGESLGINDLCSLNFAFYKFIHQLKDSKTRSSKDDSSNGSAAKAEAEELLHDLHWSVPSVRGFDLALVPGGEERKVYFDEIEAYVEAAVDRQLNESAEAIQAFRYGLLEVAGEAVTVLRWYELEAVVCGNREIDVIRLKENTEYDDDITAKDPHICYFWETLFEMSETEKTAFLRFVWARPTLPPRGSQFPQKMRVQSVCEDPNMSPDSYLPKAHTCFFSINLPRYTSKRVMGERLRYAINNCTEMDADYKLTDGEEVSGWSVRASSFSARL